MFHLTATGLVALLAILGPAVAAPPPLRATSLDSSTCVGNRHVYRSGLSYNIKGSNYIVHCGKDSTGAAIFSQEISHGDFTSCFKTCERTKGCNGFTHVGGKNGICYFKSEVGGTFPASDDVITCKKDHDGPRGLEPEPDSRSLPQHGLGHHIKSSHQPQPGHWTRPEGRLESRAAEMNEHDLGPTKTHSHHAKSKHDHLSSISATSAMDSGSILTHGITSSPSKRTAASTSSVSTTAEERPMLNSSPKWCKEWIKYQKEQHMRVLIQDGNPAWDRMWLKDPARGEY